MSKKHSQLLKSVSGRSVAKKEDIYRSAEAVWKGLTAAAIAHGCVLAYRIGYKVIKYRGKNDFLQGGLSSDVRADYVDQDWGVMRKDDNTAL